MNHPIYVIWAVPRSTSTAFEWMMRQRGDLTCFHEPFGEAWYQGEEPLWPRFTEDSVTTPGLTLESVWQTLQEAAKHAPVFSKDFPHYISTIADDEFLRQFNHSFLIRDPAKSISSMYKHWPDFHADEVALKEQRALFDQLTKLLGHPPPLIDSDDLLANPEAIVKAWCEAIGIAFIPEALSWEAGARDEVSWWDGGSFHENLRNSTGLTPQPVRHANIDAVSERAYKIYEDVKPHYDYLRSFRIEV
ncbi:MAG: sulfotransferase family protein [Pseudomonadota bacterium]